MGVENVLNHNISKNVEKNLQNSPSHLTSEGIKSINRTIPLSKKRWTKGMEASIKGFSIVIIVSLWYLVTKLELVSPTLFPSPASTWAAFTDLLTHGYKGNMLWEHWGHSMFRMLLAFLLAIATAIPLGLLSGYSSKVQAALDPLVEFYRPIPPLAYYVLLILWFGIGDLSKIVLLYLAAFPPMYIAAMSAVRGVHEDQIYSAQSLGANKWQEFRYVIFPSCLPNIFTGLRTATGFTYTTLVASEVVAAVNGIGWMVLDASKFLRSDIMLVGIIIMGLTGIFLDWLIRIAERKAVPWKGKA